VVVADAGEDLVVLGALNNILVAPVVREDSDLVLVRVVDEVINAAIPPALPDLA
jgi:predicted Kef-type K+ transport protein